MGLVILLLIAASMLILKAITVYVDIKIRARADKAERTKQTKKGRE